MNSRAIKDFWRVIKSVLWPWFSHWLQRDLPRGGWGLYDLIRAQIVHNIITEKYAHVFDLVIDIIWICGDVFFFKLDILIITWYFSLLLFHKASWGRFQRLLLLFYDLDFTLTVAILWFIFRVIAVKPVVIFFRDPRRLLPFEFHNIIIFNLLFFFYLLSILGFLFNKVNFKVFLFLDLVAHLFYSSLINHAFDLLRIGAMTMVSVMMWASFLFQFRFVKLFWLGSFFEVLHPLFHIEF